MTHPSSALTQHTPVGISVGAGCVAIVATALVAAALFPAGETGGRAVVMAIMVGVFAAVVAEIRAVVVVTGLAVLIFIGFLVNAYGRLDANGDHWTYVVPLVLGAVIGRAQRWMRPSRPDHAV